MAPRKTDTEVSIAALAVTALVAILFFLFASAAIASTSGCGRIGVKVSKHRVKPGKTLRVSGTTCSVGRERPRVVHIKFRTRHGWRQVGISRTHRTGRFSRRIRVPVRQPATRAATSTRLRVVASDAQSPSVSIKLDSDSSSSGSNCPLQDPSYEVGATIEGCRVIASDTASNPNPIPFWGGVAVRALPQSRLQPHRPPDQRRGRPPDRRRRRPGRRIVPSDDRIRRRRLCR